MPSSIPPSPLPTLFLLPITKPPLCWAALEAPRIHSAPPSLLLFVSLSGVPAPHLLDLCGSPGYIRCSSAAVSSACTSGGRSKLAGYFSLLCFQASPVQRQFCFTKYHSFQSGTVPFMSHRFRFTTSLPTMHRCAFQELSLAQQPDKGELPPF